VFAPDNNRLTGRRSILTTYNKTSNEPIEKEDVTGNKFKYQIKLDRRKRKNRAPANHPWRQYKLAEKV
jgi:hypothetical protein